MPVMIQFKPDTPATGTITTVAVANLVDGETFTLDDGVNTVVFEFDVAGDGVTAGRVAVDVSTDVSADDVRDTIIAVINAQDPASFTISAASGGAATVDLTHELGGTVGNTTSAETVADVGFILTNMAGGLDNGAFSGPLAPWAAYKNKVRWIFQSDVESTPHIAHGTWIGGPAGSYKQPPNSSSVVVKYGGPSWFTTALEFNNLPYQEIRAQIANEVERGILQVIDTTGAVASAADIRGTITIGSVS